ncbi:uncharacterized protein BKA78DRAFT_14978 [Phyllosticta capitalensis]|uniref:uncharacterized protein n=1 Tax=Phyllosticta capitalensis TaxID=121624 RepID=UPI0031301503
MRTDGLPIEVLQIIQRPVKSISAMRRRRYMMCCMSECTVRSVYICRMTWGQVVDAQVLVVHDGRPRRPVVFISGHGRREQRQDQRWGVLLDQFDARQLQWQGLDGCFTLSEEAEQRSSTRGRRRRRRGSPHYSWLGLGCHPRTSELDLSERLARGMVPLACPCVAQATGPMALSMYFRVSLICHATNRKNFAAGFGTR